MRNLLLALSLIGCSGDIPINTAPDAAMNTGTDGSVTDGTVSTNYNYYVYAAGQDGLHSYVVDPTTKLLGGHVPATTENTLCLAVDPLGRFVFTTERQTNNTYSVVTYAVNAATGGLTRGPVLTTTHQFPYNMIVNPAGTYLFVGDNDAARVVSYAIAPATGALTVVNDASVTVSGSSSNELQVHPTGSVVYLGGGGLRLINVAANGSVSAGTTVTDALANVKLSRSGTRLFTGPDFGGDEIDIYSVEATSGAVTPVTTFDTNAAGVRRMVTDPQDELLFVPRSNGTIAAYPIAANGALSAGAAPVTLMDPGNVAASFFSIDVHPAGGMLYVHSRNNQGGDDTLHQVSVSETGALAAAGPVQTGLGTVFQIRVLRAPAP